MQVFKAYFKIIQQNMIGTLIYFVVFLLISIMTAANFKPNPVAQFEPTSTRIAIFNQDKASEEIEGLRQWLMDHNEIITIGDSEEAIQDALFFRNVEYAIVIPVGFGEALYDAKPLDIQSYRIPDSYVGVYLDMEVNRYFQMLRLYENYHEESKSNHIAMVLEQMKMEVPVTITSATGLEVNHPADYFFKYASYMIVSAVLFCVTTFMILFHEPEISKRTSCSPIKPVRMQLQILAANLVIVVGLIAVLMVVSVLLFQQPLFSYQSLLYAALMLVYAVMSIALALLVSNFAKNKSILTAIVTTLSLAFAFLGGTFVPQELLGEEVNLIGSFTPSFWYTRACETIAQTTTWDASQVQQYLVPIGIILCFGLAYLAVGLVVSHLRKYQTA